MRYLVTGGSGLIGSRFVDLTKEKNKILSPNEKTLDITDKDCLEKYFKDNASKFDVVINFAAFTDVDGAEKQRKDKSGLVWRLNVEGAENLAKESKKRDKFLIQISTDFVFSGTEDNPGPYDEDVKLPGFSKKISWYGWTKSVAEKKVRKACPNSAVVRTAYPFYAAEYKQKTDFAKKILELYDQGKLYPLFEDQVITPVYVDDLVKALQKLSKLAKPGIYHVVSNPPVNYWNFSSYLVEKARGVKGAVNKGSMEEFLRTPGRTPRPRLGGLKSQKTQKILGMKFKSWKQAVDEFVKQLKIKSISSPAS